MCRLICIAALVIVFVVLTAACAQPVSPQQAAEVPTSTPTAPATPPPAPPSCREVATLVARYVGAIRDPGPAPEVDVWRSVGVNVDLAELENLAARSEVILMGTQAGRDAVVATATALPDPILLDKGSREAHAADQVVGGWTMQTYEVMDAGRKPVHERIGEVLTIAAANDVLADPNYLIQAGAQGPTTFAFSPWIIGESPSGGASAAAAAAFPAQWAFGQWPGIDLPGTTPPPCGGGVKVHVLDTNPGGNYGVPVTVEPPTTSATCQDVACSVSSHGLFVASLIKHVAPDSDAHLYPVLNARGLGTLEDLEAVVSKLVQPAGTPQIHEVMNLSLGAVWVPQAYGITPEALQATELPKSLQAKGWKKEAKDLRTLYYYLVPFIENGGVIVAAAGNHAQGWMQYPAAFSDVIGVEASNLDGKRSCYSNYDKYGDRRVAAPAGDGDTSAGCVPAASQCPQMQAAGTPCPFGIVGRVIPNGDVTHAYWAGTSFAAPLVSGLAACMLSAQPGAFGAGTDVSQGVFDRIADCAGPGIGVIDVQKTLAGGCPPRTPPPTP